MNEEITQFLDQVRDLQKFNKIYKSKFSDKQLKQNNWIIWFNKLTIYKLQQKKMKHKLNR